VSRDGRRGLPRVSIPLAASSASPWASRSSGPSWPDRCMARCGPGSPTLPKPAGGSWPAAGTPFSWLPWPAPPAGPRRPLPASRSKDPGPAYQRGHRRPVTALQGDVPREVPSSARLRDVVRTPRGGPLRRQKETGDDHGRHRIHHIRANGCGSLLPQCLPRSSPRADGGKHGRGHEPGHEGDNFKFRTHPHRSGSRLGSL
jgi:hypothetical protein